MTVFPTLQDIRLEVVQPSLAVILPLFLVALLSHDLILWPIPRCPQRLGLNLRSTSSKPGFLIEASSPNPPCCPLLLGAFCSSAGSCASCRRPSLRPRRASSSAVPRPSFQFPLLPSLSGPSQPPLLASLFPPVHRSSLGFSLPSPGLLSKNESPIKAESSRIVLCIINFHTRMELGLFDAAKCFFNIFLLMSSKRRKCNHTSVLTLDNLRRFHLGEWYHHHPALERGSVC